MGRLTAGLKGPRSPECDDGCRLHEERGDHCRKGACYARLTPTKNWDQADEWRPAPVPDIAGRDL